VILPNFRQRLFIRDKLAREADFQPLEYWMSMKNIIHFFTYHLHVHEPRPKYLEWYGLKDPCLPFIPYEYQKEYILKVCDCIDNGRDLLTEKSRDEGATWMLSGILLWYWLRKEGGNDFLLGSRKEEYVDRKGVVDTLFEKIRYNLYRLHPIFLPKGFDISKHDNVRFIINPESGNFFRGESNNSNFGTSGRYRAIFADEFSKWEETDHDAWTSMGDSTQCRLPVSTPWGMGRKFAQLRFSGAVEVETLHWTDHPLKSTGLYEGQHPYFPEKGIVKLSPWYLAECERRKDDPTASIGQELDIDYLSSGTPYFNNLNVQKRYEELQENLPEVKRYGFERQGFEIEIFENSDGNIYILNEPVLAERLDDVLHTWKYRYCISGDVAEGLEKGDNSVFYVFDRAMGKDVAWFVGKVDTTTFALLLNYFGVWYGMAYIAVENNNHGHAVIQNLKEIYPNLYFEGDFTKPVDLQKHKLGWNTNSISRPILCDRVREAINEENDGVSDLQFYTECLTFIHNRNGKPEADTGALDDRVFAQGIKWMVHSWLPAPKKISEYEEKFKGMERFGGAKSETRKDIRQIWN